MSTTPVPHTDQIAAMRALESFGDTLAAIFGVMRWHPSAPPPADLLVAIEEAQAIVERAAAPLLASRIGPARAEQLEAIIAEIASGRGLSPAELEREVRERLAKGGPNEQPDHVTRGGSAPS